MNKLNITIISTLLLTATATTLAQESYGERGKKGQHQQRGMQTMPMVDKLSRAIRRLDLDDEQRESIKAVMHNMKEEVRPIMKNSKAGHHELMQLIKANTYDEQAVSALAEEEGKLAAERMIISGRAISDVFGLLTDEQRDQLETMAAEHRGQRGERRPSRDEE